MKHRFRCLLVLLAMLGPTSAAAGLEPFGLQGKVVTSLGIYGSLYAGTIGDGVFRRGTVDTAGWTSLGLAGRRIRSVYPHKFGPLGIATTAGVEPEFTTTDSALVYCSTNDQPDWAVTDSGMTRGRVRAVFSLDGFPDPTICGETFAATVGSDGQVWRRGFTSSHWEKVLDLGIGVGNVVRADQRSGNVWAGGETSIFAPWIARSTDRGTTWQVSYPDLAGDNACDAIAFHPTDPDVAYAGMEGAVLRTVDGGVTWTLTGLRNTSAYTYGLALDSGDPDHIFAGGMIANPNSWAMWESFDRGATWQVVPPPVTSQAVVSGISSIVADPSRPGTVYVATFGHGVWRYVRPSAGVDRDVIGGVVLAQNYPNPFGPETTIRLRIPAWLQGSQVRLGIYDAGGAHRRTLVDRIMDAGMHRIAWDGRDENGRLVPAGVYFCHARVGPLRRATKICVMR